MYPADGQNQESKSPVSLVLVQVRLVVDNKPVVGTLSIITTT